MKSKSNGGPERCTSDGLAEASSVWTRWSTDVAVLTSLSARFLLLRRSYAVWRDALRYKDSSKKPAVIASRAVCRSGEVVEGPPSRSIQGHAALNHRHPSSTIPSLPRQLPHHRHLSRLRDKIIHASLKRPLAMLFVVQGGESDDLRSLPPASALRFKRADLPRGLDPVQDRHGQVHEDQIVGCRAGLEDFERFAAVGGCVVGAAAFFH